MNEALSERVIRSIEQANGLYYRLVIVVGSSGSGKTAALKEVHNQIEAPLFNINLELSREMLDLTEQQRVLHLPRILSEIVTSVKADVALLDNIEVIFNTSLRQDPLRLLQGLSRNQTIVSSWNGHIDKGYLFYATPDHPEYQKYPVRDFLVVSPGA